MRSFSIESNGRIENTAVYYNGEQLGGIKEIFLNLEEDGTFDAVIRYEGSDKNMYTKQIFQDYFENIKIRPAAFDEEEAQNLQLLTIESDGEIENTVVFRNDQSLDGLISLLVHIKNGVAKDGGIKALFNRAPDTSEPVTFRAELTFRNDDDSTQVEGVFA
ncbi:MAG: hypothetical protein IPM69_01690 [Ignavibacteria bacterium]|nr:hypothetical protein [Ignavibacteria bacterium]